MNPAHEKIEEIWKNCNCNYCISDCAGCGEPRGYCGSWKGSCDNKKCESIQIVQSLIIEELEGLLYKKNGEVDKNEFIPPKRLQDLIKKLKELN